MQSVKINDIKEFTAEKFMKKVPLETDKIVFNTFYFKQRQLLPFHKHPEFTVGGEQIIVGPTSAVYGPAGTFHGLVNSGDKDMIVISVQGPKPVETVFAENATYICPVCKQEVILKDGAKEGDKVVCPRCQAKLTISKTKDGKWDAKQ